MGSLKSNQNGSNDENMTSRHINIPHYPSTLSFLSHDADRTELMANIRNGINLRDEEISTMKQNIYNEPPKRLKDSFTSDHIEESAHFPINFMPQNEMKQSHEIMMNNSFSLETPIDQHLILGVHRNGVHKKNTRKPGPAPFSNEVAERANIIRQRFGKVEVSTGIGRKRFIDQHNNVLQVTKTLKSGEIANRIAKIKHKLDQVTDNESWLITRIENVFLTANR